MIVKETEDSWEFIYFPEAEDSSITKEEEGIVDGVKDNWEKGGYRIQMGIINGNYHVPKKVNYSKAKFTFEQAVGYARRVRDCGICKRLNANVDKVEKVILKDQYKRPEIDVTEEVSSLKEEIKELKKKLEGPPERKNAAKDLYQKIALDMFKAQFTPAGLIELALIFDDPSFIEDLLPANPTEEDLLELKAEMAAFWAGEEGRYKTPEQLKEYAKMQRDMVKALKGEPVGEEHEEEKAKTKRLRRLGKRVRVVA